MRIGYHFDNVFSILISQAVVKLNEVELSCAFMRFDKNHSKDLVVRNNINFFLIHHRLKYPSSYHVVFPLGNLPLG